MARVLLPPPRAPTSARVVNGPMLKRVLRIDVVQGTPSTVEGRGDGRRGPSTLRESQGRRDPGRTTTLLRTIPSHVQGWRSLAVGVENTADRSEARTTDASTAGECVDRGEVRAAEFEPDPPCGRGGMIGSELPT